MSEAEREYRYDLLFGRAEQAYYPLSAICVFKQVRDTIERESVEELKASLIIEHADGSIETDLINEVSVAELDESHAELFLQELNLARDTAYTLADLPRGDDGMYVFLINGHSRRQSIAEIAEERDITPDRVAILAKVFRNVGYFEAVRRQLNENIYTKPKPYEEAQLVVDLFNLRKIQEPDYTPARCARELGMSANRISDALAYSGLPDIVKEMVIKGTKRGGITYSVAIELARIQRAYLLRYKSQQAAGNFCPYAGGDTPEAAADYQTAVFLQRIYNRMSENGSTNAKKLTAFINIHIEELSGRDAADYEQLLFELDAEAWGPRGDRARARAVGRAVSRLMVGGLVVAAKTDPALLHELGVRAEDLAFLSRALAEAAGKKPDEGVV